MPQFNPEWLGMGHGLIMGFEKRVCPRGQRQAAAMALRAACSEMKIRRTHYLPVLDGGYRASDVRQMRPRTGPGEGHHRVRGAAEQESGLAARERPRRS